ncbi:MAG: KxYKxGKxW signal peptide domain-containing protein [Lactobacillaceae bacterium]|jgi:hypothetical protein|nr:KxYKxGKxW signal peptide domain-containing protein [Lactobacillaceae bacterium]
MNTKRFKMYKDGKKWVVAGIAMAALTMGLTSVDAHADSATPLATSDSLAVSKEADTDTVVLTSSAADTTSSAASNASSVASSASSATSSVASVATTPATKDLLAGNQYGTDNTATAGLGSAASDGSAAATKADTNTYVTVKNGGAKEVDNVDYNGTTPVNANGAITADNQNPSKITFDVVNGQQLNTNLSVLNGDNGEFTWTISTSEAADLAASGLEVANLDVEAKAARDDNGNILANQIGADVTTAGGNTYHIDTDVLDAIKANLDKFTPTSEAAASTAANSAAIAGYQSAYEAASSAAASEGAAYAAASAAGDKAAMATALAAKQGDMTQMANALNQIAAIDTSASATSGTVGGEVANKAVVSVTFTTPDGSLQKVDALFGDVWGQLVAGPVPAIVLSINQGIQAISTSVSDVINGNIVADLVTGLGNTAENLISGFAFPTVATNAVAGLAKTMGLGTQADIDAAISGNTQAAGRLISAIAAHYGDAISTAMAAAGIKPNVEGLLNGGADLILNTMRPLLAPIFSFAGINQSNVQSALNNTLMSLDKAMNNVSNAFKQYASSVDASRQQVLALDGEAAPQGWGDAASADGKNTTFSVNTLADVVKQADGSYKVSTNLSPVDAITSKMQSVVQGYIQGLTSGLGAITTMPANLVNALDGLEHFNANIDLGDNWLANSIIEPLMNNSINGLAHLVGGSYDKLMTAAFGDGTTAGLTSKIPTLVQELSAEATQYIAGMSSKIADAVATANIGGKATMAVSFTGNTPTDETSGAAGAYTAAKDGEFVPETFTVTTDGGKAVQKLTTYTTVMLQKKDVQTPAAGGLVVSDPTDEVDIDHELPTTDPIAIEVAGSGEAVSVNAKDYYDNTKTTPTVNPTTPIAKPTDVDMTPKSGTADITKLAATTSEAAKPATIAAATTAKAELPATDAQDAASVVAMGVATAASILGMAAVSRKNH